MGTSVKGMRDNQRIRVMFCDQLSLARGKYVPPSFASKGEVRICKGVYAVTLSKDLVPDCHGGVEEGLPDVELVFDPDALRPCWEPNTHIAIADVYEHGKPSPLCGRSALKRAIAAWQELGFDPMIGMESEAYILQKNDGQWDPYSTPGSVVYGTGAFSDPDGLMAEIWQTAYDCGLKFESFNAEYDSPQFELTLPYTDALKACDDFFLFRNMAREILYSKGYLLSFMPKPFPKLSGTGLHINLSFRDKNQKNALAEGTKRGNLSNLTKGCISGMLHHHESLGCLLAPTVNSYARLQPVSLAGYWANWGYDHRGVAVRVSGEDGEAARIEQRTGDCSASPYLAVAAVLQSALLGFTKNYQLPAEETGDCIESVNTDRKVAASLEESISHLEKDIVLREAIGATLIDNFMAVKKKECEELAGKGETEILDYYLPFI